MATHAASSALVLGECASGLSAGINLMLLPAACVGCAVAGMTSARGRCHTFDARADGFARSEAVIAAVLQAGGRGGSVIAGQAVRSDGRSASFTAPNGHAQQEMLAAALAMAGTGADAIGCYEAHGTGTALGDPTEVGSLAAVLLRPRKAKATAIALCSVKGNVGHVEPGAGLLGLLTLECARKQGVRHRMRSYVQ